MDRYRDFQLLVLGVCLMVGLIVASAIGTYGLITAKRAGTEVVTVTGAASQDVQSDLAKWQPGFTHYASTMAAAYNGLQEDTAKVLAYLKENGIPASQVEIQPPTVETLYERLSNGSYSNVVEGYRVRQSLNIESKDIQRLQQLSIRSMELVNRGVAFETATPQFFITRLDDMKVKMLGLATENAKQRAQAMAKSTGNRVGSMRSSQMGVFQITPKHSTEVADYGINDTSTPEKKVTAVVNVTFALR